MQCRNERWNFKGSFAIDRCDNEGNGYCFSKMITFECGTIHLYQSRHGLSSIYLPTSICKYHFHKRNRIRFRYIFYTYTELRDFVHTYTLYHVCEWVWMNGYALHICRDCKFKYNAYHHSYLTTFSYWHKQQQQEEEHTHFLAWDSWLQPCLILANHILLLTLYCVILMCFVIMRSNFTQKI